MRTILITYGCLSCLFSAGYGEENQPTVSDIPSCGILEAGKQTEIAALEQAAEHIAANALYQIEVDHVDSVQFDAEMVRKLLG